MTTEINEYDNVTVAALLTLEDIVSRGNRGHWGDVENNRIVCGDGTRLSVLAGNGTYSSPRPMLCGCAHGVPFTGTVWEGWAPHDYHGPYQMVEVWLTDFQPTPQGWVAAEDVRAYIIDHAASRPQRETGMTE